MGTTPLDRRKSGMTLVTIARLWNDGVEKHYFVIWRSNELIQIFRASKPFPISLFRKITGHHFMNFHPFLQGSVSLDFVMERGKVDLLTVYASGKNVSAWR
jgi:hypothetical protein